MLDYLLEGFLDETFKPKVIAAINNHDIKKIIKEYAKSECAKITSSDNRFCSENLSEFQDYVNSKLADDIRNVVTAANRDDAKIYLRTLEKKVKWYEKTSYAPDGSLCKIVTNCRDIVRNHYWNQLDDKYKFATKELRDELASEVQRIPEIINNTLQESTSNPDGINSHAKFPENFSETFHLAAQRQFDELIRVGNKFNHLNIVKELFPETATCELDFTGIDENNEEFDLLELISKNSSENLLILGDGGIGKTTILFRLLKLYHANPEHFQQIPMYIELNQCPLDVNSWSYDDKTSVFIEKSVAEILLNKKFVEKSNPVIEYIQREFQKEAPPNGPQYLLLLDGLNEVAIENTMRSSSRFMLENEIANALQRYQNVRFIITSRDSSKIIKNAKKIHILGIVEEKIQSFLQSLESERKIAEGTASRVIHNRPLLNCLKIPLFFNMFCVSSTDSAITTRGEILRDFFHKKRENLYHKNLENNKQYGFILDFIVSELAWEMIVNNTFSISFGRAEEVINKVLTDKEGSYALSAFSDDVFQSEESPQIICTALIMNYGSEVTEYVLDVMVSNLAIMYVDRGIYKFKHQYFRDYFAAVHITTGMIIGIKNYNGKLRNEGPYLDDIKSHRLQSDIIIFISEMTGLHHTNPQCTESGWTYRENWDSNSKVMLDILDVFRSRFEEDFNYALWNIVQIFVASGMGVLGVDLSDLNLEKVRFNGILCGIDRNLPNLAAKFNNSILNIDSFFPENHNEIVRCAKCSHDGQYIVTMSDTKILLWNAEYNIINKLELDKAIDKFIFSKNSDYIICRADKDTLLLWIFGSDTELQMMKCPSEIADFCAGDSNDVVYVALENGEIRKLRIPDLSWHGKVIRVNSPIDEILFDHNHDKLIVKESGGEVVFENLFGVRTHYNKKVRALVQTDNGVLWIVTCENTIYLSDLSTEDFTFFCNVDSQVTQFCVSPDGSYIAYVIDGDTVIIRKVANNRLLRPLKCEHNITSISFNKTSTHLITSAGDKYAKIWDVESDVGVCIRPLGDTADWIRNAYYSPNEAFIATSSVDSTGKIWSTQNRRLEKLLYGHSDRVTAVAYDREGQTIVTTSDDCSAKVWDANTARCLKTLDHFEKPVHNAAFNKNGQILVTVSWDNTGTIWNLENSSKPIKLIGHSAPVHTVQFDASFEKLITSSNDKSAIVWDAETGKQTGICVSHNDRLNSAAFSPDGKYLITSSFDRTAKIWTSKGEYVHTLIGHNDSVRSAQFSPDGKYIITVSRDTHGIIWDVENNFSRCTTLYGHTFFVRSAMFNKESNRILTASYDGSIREWNLSGDCISVIKSIPGMFICGCDFSNLNPKYKITPEQKNTCAVHGALTDSL